MCTFTWTAAPRRDGYDLFFNRDERHPRAVETPPAFGETDGLRWLAPRDAGAGGTWMLVNAAGLTLALLNDYATPWRPAGPARSRGLLVLDLAPARDLAAVAAGLAAVDLARLPPFHLVAVSADASARRWHWNGEKLRPETLGSPACLSSSSFATSEVVAWRLDKFNVLRAGHAGAPSPADLAAWHRVHDPERPAHSVRMLRSDAATRSLTHVCVRPVAVMVAYETFYPSANPERVWLLPLTA